MRTEDGEPVPRESATAANQMDTIHASCFQGLQWASDAGSTVDGKPSGASRAEPSRAALSRQDSCKCQEPRPYLAEVCGKLHVRAHARMHTRVARLSDLAADNHTPLLSVDSHEKTFVLSCMCSILRESN